MTRLLAPLTGLAIFALATGYLQTLVPLRINAIHANEVFVGFVGGSYYAGLLTGSFRSEKLVVSIGHIRSFAAFMAVMCASTLGLALSNDIVVWLFMRFINGITVAGIFVVVESWLLSESSQNNRGRLVSYYMVALYGAQAIGQLFLGWWHISSMIPFVLIGIFLSLSILPTTVFKIPAPEIEQASSLGFLKLYRLTPSGVIGCFFGGMVLSALYTLLPIYLTDQDSDISVGILMGLTITGGMLMQYPAGHLSDLIDRRLVLSGIATMGAMVSLAVYLFQPTMLIQILLLFIIGGTTFTLYPVAISHACDHMEPQDIVAGTQGLLLAYSTGSCFGPVFAGMRIIKNKATNPIIMAKKSGKPSVIRFIK